MPPGLALGSILEREDPRDALIAMESQTLDDLPKGARVGTSSLRRRALLARWRPDLELLELRGNVPTRIRKLDEGGYDAIVLAAAGVSRLGMRERISSYLPVHRFLPAVSQGAIGIQIRSEDDEKARWVMALDHPPTRSATSAERALLRTLEGGCHVPVGALAEVAGKSLSMKAVVCSVDGTRSVEGETAGFSQDAAALGIALAEDLLTRGGNDILESIRKAGGAG